MATNPSMQRSRVLVVDPDRISRATTSEQPHTHTHTHEDVEETITFYGAPGAFAAPRAVDPSHAADAYDVSNASTTSPATTASASVPKISSWARVVRSKNPQEDAAAGGKPAPAGVALPASTASTVSAAPGSASAASSTSTSSNSAAAARDAPLCVYFLTTGCRFGEACKYKHSLPDPDAVDFFVARIRDAQASDNVSALMTAAGAAPAPDAEAGGGDDATFAAASDAWQSAESRKRSALVEDAVARGIVNDYEEGEVALQIAERQASDEVTCGICFEQVTAHPTRKFGLLTGCTHAFCLDCIRQWRARVDLPKDTVRRCPICRQLSFFVVPCDRLIIDPHRKASVNSQYQQAQSAVPCRYFDYGRGTCPFGTSCWYAHLNPDGTPAVMSKPTVRVDSEGGVSVTRSFKLSEYL